VSPAGTCIISDVNNRQLVRQQNSNLNITREHRLNEMMARTLTPQRARPKRIA